MKFIGKRKFRAEDQRHNYLIDIKSNRKWELWNKDNNEVYQVTKPTYVNVYKCSCKDFKFRVKKIRSESGLLNKRELEETVNCKHIEMIKNI